MTKPGFPEFSVQDEDDAAEILAEMFVLSDYVCDLEPWVILSDDAESTLISALDWMSYAVRQLNDARVRLVNTNEGAWYDVHTVLNLLRIFQPKIESVLEYNEELKKEAKAKEEQGEGQGDWD
ncbi:hypothetical protein F4813DRAFT_389430 [Daldinia decipiens]|uniref:uncharacterized protein n=1 Tax=Daldinia decipiens TaxID=326647 RepID=UPI0020C4CCA4|nr:uncharacterized protein F4813DRAFT_389430 [Daldinia decipiens]KAI1657693.1 hypothetical protein F4813DRAFT_389430 [Daldinia decipiens]